MMKVKFLMDHPGYPVGTVTTVTTCGAGLSPGVVEQLERRGIIAPVPRQAKQSQAPRRQKQAKRSK